MESEQPQPLPEFDLGDAYGVHAHFFAVGDRLSVVVHDHEGYEAHRILFNWSEIASMRAWVRALPVLD